MGAGGKRAGAGRKRKPREMRVIEGTFRPKQHGEPPAVVGGFPAPPASLTADEARLWETFPKPPWIGETDVVVVHAAVCVYARLLSLQARAKVEEWTPAAIDQEAKLWGRLLSLLASLGLTPADRAKMPSARVDEAREDKWAGIL